MNATLNIGQTIGDFCVEEFVKASDENGGETFFVSGREPPKTLSPLGRYSLFSFELPFQRGYP